MKFNAVSRPVSAIVVNHAGLSRIWRAARRGMFLALAVLALMGGSLSLSVQAAEAGVPGPLEALWRFNEVSGTAILDATGRYPGVLKGLGGLRESAGLQGGAVRLRLESDGGGQVYLGDVLPLVGESYSISAWFKLANSVSRPSLILWSKHRPGVAAGYFIQINDGWNGVTAYVGDASAMLSGSEDLANGQWHHVVVTHQLGVRSRLYLDGTLRATSTSSAPLLPTTGALIFGGIDAVPPQPGAFFDGWLDEIQVYGSELQAADVTYLRSHPGALAGGDVLPARLFPEGQSAYGSLVVRPVAAVPGVTLRYTQDGTDPEVASPVAPETLLLTASATVKVAAFNGTTRLPGVAAASYVVQPNQGPSIETSPASVAVPFCRDATLSVVARGTPPLSYEWEKDGVVIDGANQPVLVLPRVDLAGAGAYRVRVRNALGSTLSDPATLTVLEPTGSLISHWKLEGRGGSTVEDETGRFPGVRSLPGTRYRNDGIAGNCLRFEASSSGHVRMGSGLAMVPYAAYTFAFWVRQDPGQNNPDAWLVTHHPPAAGGGEFVAMAANGRNLTAYFGSLGSRETGAVLAADGLWHHVAMTHDVAGEDRFYFDGVMTARWAPDPSQQVSGAEFMLGGADASHAQGTFTGSLDEVQLYDFALSPTQVAFLKRHPGANAERLPGLVQVVPGGGRYPGSVEIRMAVHPEGTPVRYTLDGTEPGPASTLYTGPFRLDHTATVRAVAVEGATRRGEISTASFQVDALVAPAFAGSLSDVIAVEGSRVTVDSGVTGSEPLSFQWEKDGVPADARNGRTLEFPAIGAEHAGVYRLRVSNAASEVLSGSFRITVNEPVGGLEGWWRFDAEEAGWVADELGHLPGRLAGPSASIVDGGRLGRAVRLGATGDGSVDFGEVLPLVPGSWSVSIWCRFPAGAVFLSAPILGRHVPGNPGGYFIVANSQAPTLVGYAGSSGTPVTATRTINDGAWHQVVLTSQKRGAVKLYVDGELAGRLDQPGTVESPATSFQMGALGSSLGQSGFNGSLDEAQVYSFALTPEEVGQLYRAPASVARVTEGTVWIQPPGGTGLDEVRVRLVGTRTGGEIRYTDDGTDPTASSPVYSGVLRYARSVQIKAADFEGGVRRGPIATAQFTVVPGEAPALVRQPVGRLGWPGDSVRFEVSATGSEPLRYQWSRDGVDLVDQTNAVLVLGRLSKAAEGAYRVRVFNTVSSVLSDAADLLVSDTTSPVMAYWKFDETTGLTVEDSARTHDGTMRPSGVERVADGIHGNAIRVDGSRGGSISFGDELPMVASSYSVSLWVKGDRTSFGPVGGLLTKHRRGLSAGYFLMVSAGGDQVTGFSGDTGQLVQARTALADGAWHHVVMTYGRLGPLKLYIDGTVRAGSTPSQPLSDSIADLRLGGWSGEDGAAAFHGYLDEVQVYSVELSAEQVAGLHANPGTLASGVVAPLLASPAEGSFFDRVEVRLVSSVSHAVIRYTTDGSEPGLGSAEYGAGIVLASTATVRAISVLNGTRLPGEFRGVYTVVGARAPVIERAPVGGDFVAGGRVELRVEASGPAPLSFQWERDGEAVPSATASTLVLDPVSWWDAGAYRVRVSNALGSVVSDPVVVRVREPEGPRWSHWRFEELSGGELTDEAGAYVGRSPSGTPTLVPAGGVGRALRVDGTASGEVHVGDVLSLAATPFTLSAWFKVENIGAAQPMRLLGKRDAALPGGYSLSLMGDGSGLSARGGGSARLDVPATLADGAWHHVVMMQSAAGRLRLYLDGELTGPGITDELVAPSPAEFIFGGPEGQVPSSGFSGLLDEVQFFGFELSARQVSYLRANPGASVTGELPALQIEPPGGRIFGPTTVIVARELSGRQVRVTLNGEDPIAASPLYAGPLTVDSSLTVKAALFDGASRVGPVVSAAFAMESAAPPNILVPPVTTSLPYGATALFTVKAEGTPPLSYEWEKDGRVLAGETRARLAVSTRGGNAVAGMYRVRVRNAHGVATSVPVMLNVIQPSGNLLARWRFESLDGGQVLDETGRHHGTASVTGTTLIDGGASGRAIALSEAAGGLVRFGEVLGLDVASSTISLWCQVMPGQAGVSAGLLTKHRPGWPAGYYLALNTAGKVVSGYSGNSERFVGSDAVIADGRWHHLAMVHALGDSVRIYVDGVESLPAVPSVPVSPVAADLILGGFDLKPARGNFSGRVDEVQIYDFAISSDQAETLARNPAYVVTDGASLAPLQIFPDGGQFYVEASVRLVRNGPGGLIRYTVDGSTPGLDSPEYLEPLRLTQSGTVKAALFSPTERVGDVVSAVFVIEPEQAPTIVTQPTGLTAAEGNSATMRIVIKGFPEPTFQWERDGVPIPDQTRPELRLEAATPADSGIYQVRVVNTLGSAVSDPVELVVVPPTGPLLAHWRFDALDGATVVDETGHHPGTLQGAGASLDNEAVAGRSLKLDRGRNDHVRMGDVLPLQDTAYSVSLWMRALPGSATPDAALFGKHRIGNAAGHYLVLNAAGQTISGYSGSVEGRVGATTPVDDGRWHHVVVTYVPYGEYRLYLDGALTQPGTRSAPVLPTPGEWVLGGLDYAPARGTFSGWLDEVQVYGFAMGPSQVEALRRDPTFVLPSVNGSVVMQPRPGRYLGSVEVSLLKAEHGSEIRYTTDGTEPVPTSPAYTGLIPLTANTTIRAAAFRAGVQVGATVVGAYTVAPEVAPSFVTQPASITLAYGGEGALTVEVAGDPAPTYQWEKDGVSIPEATQSRFVIGSAKTADSGSYRVRVTNRAGSVTSDAAVVTVTEPAGPLLAYWRFDRAFGGEIPDELGQYPGRMGPGGGGIVTGGVRDGAMRLLGTPGSYVSMGDVLPLTGQPYSLSMWFKVPTGSSTGMQPLISKHQPGVGAGYYLVLNAAGDAVSGYSGNAARFVGARPPLSPDVWHHVLMTYHPGGVHQLYLDGVATGDPIPAEPVVPSTSQLLLGGLDFWPPSGGFDGWLDEVQVYGFALSPTQTAYLHAHPGVVIRGPLEPVGISPDGGVYTASVVVDVIPRMAGMVVRYTLDGRDPGPADPVATTSLTLTASATLSAAAFLEGVRQDPIARASFVISPAQPPTIVRQPASVSVAAGRTFVLEVEANGSKPFVYRWMKDGVAVGDVVGPRYSGRSGGSYRVVISNPYGQIESDVAVVSIVQPTGQLLAHWRFDTMSGGEVPDETGLFPGTVSATGVSLEPGLAGNAAKFDVAQNGHIRFGPILPMDDTAYSISLWTRIPHGAIGGQAGLLTRHRPGIGDGYFIMIPGSAATILAYGGDVSGVLQSSDRLDDGEWHHVAVTHPLEGEFMLYVDGVAVGAGNPAGLGTPGSAELVLGGFDLGPPAGSFNGSIDDVQIYGFALVGDQVRQLRDHPGTTLPSAPPGALHGEIVGRGDLRRSSGPDSSVASAVLRIESGEASATWIRAAVRGSERYRMEASTDLLHWIDLGPFEVSEGQGRIRMPQDGAAATRFFRLRRMDPDTSR